MFMLLLFAKGLELQSKTPLAACPLRVHAPRCMPLEGACSPSVLIVFERYEVTVGNKGMEVEECLEMCNKSLDWDSVDKVQCKCM